MKNPQSIQFSEGNCYKFNILTKLEMLIVTKKISDRPENEIKYFG